MENLIKLVFGVSVLAAIPWAVAAIKKTPMTRKGYRILSIIFAVFPCGQTYEGLGATGNFATATIVSAALGVGLYFLINRVGVAILRKRGMLQE